LDWRILPLLFLTYTLQFLDKNIVGAASILGIIQDNHLTGQQFNNLGTFFYLGILVSQIPHAYAFQKLPVAKYLAFMMFLWALFVGMHCVATNYAGLVVLRLLQGMTEGCVTPGIMLICSMFYDRTEMGERVGWTFMCNGLASIISGFIAFGAYKIPSRTLDPTLRVAQWQWFMMIVAILTFLASIVFFLFFPDSPTNAKFLNEHEKVIAVKRIRVNQSGIETKEWKFYQFIEAITDPKAYIFMLFVALANFVGGIGIQYSLIIRDFGFDTLQTTLLNIPAGACQIIIVVFSMWLLHKYPNARGWISVYTYIPSIISAALLLGLPDGVNRIALLISFYGLQLGCTPAVVLSLSWITTTTSGHTKKLTQHAMWLVAYSVGQMVSPQWWRDEYKPRNRVPWAIILTSYCCQVLLILLLRWYLNRRNVARDAAQAAATTEEEKEKFSEYGWLDIPAANGQPASRVRVEKRFLDMTDNENMNFRYVL
jgi:ACS family allantoate permease-like MFS transporter